MDTNPSDAQPEQMELPFTTSASKSTSHILPTEPSSTTAKTSASPGTALASLVNLFAPEAIIFGGSMGEEGERLIKATRHTLKKRALEVLERDIQVELCTFGQQAGVTGAVAVTLHNHYTSFEEKAATPVS